MDNLDHCMKPFDKGLVVFRGAGLEQYNSGHIISVESPRLSAMCPWILFDLDLP